jgi:hypothetical protein
MPGMKAQHLAVIIVLVGAVAVAIGCSSSTSDPEADITPPPVPSGVDIDISNGYAGLTWTAVSDRGLTGYNVYWMGGATVDTLNANRRFTTTASATISDLDYETLYSFAVSSIDGAGNESALSIQESGKPLNTTSPEPPAFVDIVAENIDFPKITIYWQANTEPDLDSYRVYRSTADGEADTLAYVDNLTNERLIDVAVDIGTTYFYRVTAIDKGGWESPQSAIVSDHVLPRVELTSPLNFTYTSTSPTFTWEPVTGAVNYNLVVTTSRIGGEIWNIEIDRNTTEIVYSGRTRLIYGNTYYWKVGAISRSEINSISDSGSFVINVK